MRLGEIPLHCLHLKGRRVLKPTGYSGGPYNAALFATKPVILNPEMITTDTVLTLPVDAVLAGNQKEFKRAQPLEGLSPIGKSVFRE